MPLTLPIVDVLPATPRARVVRIGLEGRSFAYQPGQAVLVAAHGSPASKPYSIAAAPEEALRDGWIELLVGTDAATATSGPPFALQPGITVDVDGPIGSFTFPANPDERRFLFIAGGTGIAPLRAMLHHALAIPHREVGLVHSARTPDDFAYQAEWRALADAGRIDYRQTITRTEGDAPWSGSRGRIGRAELQPLVHDTETLCFICGPRTLVDDTTRTLQELGVSRSRIKMEEW